jgi:hypothetical protein
MLPATGRTLNTKGFLKTRTEMVLETSDYSPFDQLKLVAIPSIFHRTVIKYLKCRRTMSKFLRFKLCSSIFWRNSPQWAMASSFKRLLHNTQWHTTVGRASLDEWSARRRDLYLTTHNTHNRQTSMLPVVIEPTISEVQRPQTYASDRAAAGTRGH